MIKVNISEALQEIVSPVVRQMARDVIDNEIELCRRRMDERLTRVAMDATKRLQVIVSKLPDKAGEQIDVVLTLSKEGDKA